MKPILTAQNISVRYGERIVVHVPHLDLFPGEVVAVIGPNGSGKSTLLRVLAALERPTTGRLLFHDRPVDWRRSLAYRRRIAVVLQEPLLLDLPVFHNVAIGWRLRGQAGPHVRTKVSEWLEKFRIAHLAGERARHLSGGEARRVALARAFVLEPEILFLDEPFSNLDVPTRESILVDLRRVLESSNTTALFVTHDRDEALALADRVVVLLDGRIRQVGPPEEIFFRPATQEVAEFVGVENTMAARVVARDGKWVELELTPDLHLYAESDFPPGKEVVACIRPEYVNLRPAKGNDVPARQGEHPGTIIAIHPLGTRVRAGIRVGGVVLSALLEYARWTDMDLDKGDPVWVHISPSHVHVFE